MHIGQRHAGQGDIAGVFNGIGIGDDITQRRPGGDRGHFVHRHCRAAHRRHGHRDIIGDHRVGIIRIRQADIGHIGDAAAVYIGLQRCIGPGAADEIAGLQAAGWKRLADQGRNLVIGQGGGAGQSDVANIGDDIGISDRLPGGIEIGQISGLGHHDARLNRRATADQFIRSGDRWRAGGGRLGHSGGKVGDAAAVDVILGDGIDKLAGLIDLAGLK